MSFAHCSRPGVNEGNLASADLPPLHDPNREFSSLSTCRHALPPLLEAACPQELIPLQRGVVETRAGAARAQDLAAPRGRRLVVLHPGWNLFRPAMSELARVSNPRDLELSDVRVEDVGAATGDAAARRVEPTPWVPPSSFVGVWWARTPSCPSGVLPGPRRRWPTISRASDRSATRRRSTRPRSS